MCESKPAHGGNRAYPAPPPKSSEGPACLSAAQGAQRHPREQEHGWRAIEKTRRLREKTPTVPRWMLSPRKFGAVSIRRGKGTQSQKADNRQDHTPSYRSLPTAWLDRSRVGLTKRASSRSEANPSVSSDTAQSPRSVFIHHLSRVSGGKVLALEKRSHKREQWDVFYCLELR